MNLKIGIFTDFDSEMVKKNRSNFNKTRTKCHFYKRAEFFSSVAAYFGQYSRIILERVGSTGPAAVPA